MLELSNPALIRKAAQAVQSGAIDPAADLFAESVVWHYFNPRLPELEDDYVGLAGLKTLFAKLAESTAGTLTVEPVSLTPAGPQLVVTHAQFLEPPGGERRTDGVLVWRIVDGKISEVWDIRATPDTQTESSYAPSSLTARTVRIGAQAIGSQAIGSQAVGAQATGSQAIAAQALGAQAIGALAIGACAFGALALGALAIGRLTIGHARIRRLEIGELSVQRFSERQADSANGAIGATRRSFIRDARRPNKAPIGRASI